MNRSIHLDITLTRQIRLHLTLNSLDFTARDLRPLHLETQHLYYALAHCRL
jgi:hypothetical protein